MPGMREFLKMGSWEGVCWGVACFCLIIMIFFLLAFLIKYFETNTVVCIYFFYSENIFNNLHVAEWRNQP